MKSFAKSLAVLCASVISLDALAIPTAATHAAPAAPM